MWTSSKKIPQSFAIIFVLLEFCGGFVVLKSNAQFSTRSKLIIMKVDEISILRQAATSKNVDRVQLISSIRTLEQKPLSKIDVETLKGKWEVIFTSILHTWWCCERFFIGGFL